MRALAKPCHESRLEKPHLDRFGFRTSAFFRISAFGFRPSLLVASFLLLVLAWPSHAGKNSSPHSVTKQLVIQSATVGGKTLTWRPGSVLRLSSAPGPVSFNFGPLTNC